MRCAVPALALLAAAFAGAAPGQEKEKAVPEVRKHADLAYRTDPAADPVRHRLDVYAPAGAKDRPVLFFVHGGTWRSGNKGLYSAVGEEFAKLGLVTVVINYRLSPAVKHPAHVEDVAKAFAWAKANVAKYGGNPSRITLFGHSAGGHLVSLLATDPAYLKAEKLTPADVRGVVSVSGVYTIPADFPLFHPIFGTDEKACRAASPLAHVAGAGKHPPFLLAYGDKDFDQLDRMAIDMAAALKQCDSPHTLMKCEGRNHYTIIIHAIQRDDPLHNAIRDFAVR